MRTTALGRTGLPVSRIAFGTWQLDGDWGVFAEDEAKAAIRRARELGANIFGTAQAYGFGASERPLGSSLRDELRSNRDELVIGTKGGLRRTDTGVTRDAGPHALPEGVDASLVDFGKIRHADVAMVGTRHVDHVEDNLAAADITLGETDVKEIDSIIVAATSVAGPPGEQVMTVQAKTAQTKIAVLGVGVMGAPMARNLLRAGFDVHVWNRTRERAEALVAQGARVASSPAEAASDADLLITMLTDGPAVESAMTGSAGALATLPSQAVWVQMSTVGTSATQHLAELAGRRVAFVDAPVSGSSEPAERGELLILASGNRALRPCVQPLFDAIGRQTLWLDRVGDGSRLKLVLNNWLAVLAEGMAETMSLTTALGLNPDQVLATLSESPLGSAYAVTKGHAMVQHDFTPGFPLRHAAKDITLALSAADHHEIELPLTEAVLKRWDDAIAGGHGDEDVAAAITAS